MTRTRRGTVEMGKAVFGLGLAAPNREPYVVAPKLVPRRFEAVLGLGTLSRAPGIVRSGPGDWFRLLLVFVLEHNAVPR